jgi:hypothetical protein
VAALNATAVRLGGTGGHLFNIGALNEIAVLLGGAGDHRMHVDALAQIEQRLGSGPGTPGFAAAPEIEGTPQVGQMLTAATDGTWTGSPTLARSWQRDGVDIAGETAAAYAVSEADDGTAIRLRVTATNDAGSATAYSAAISIAYAPPVGSTTPGSFAVDLGAGSQVFDARPLFTVAGDADLSGCSFALRAGGASVLAGSFAGGDFTAGAGSISIDPDTGTVTDDGSGEAVAGSTITIACSNSGGTATAAVAYHAEPPATLAYVGATSSFRGAGPVTEVRFASGAGQTPSFPAAPVAVPGSLILLMAHRAASGGVGGLSNIPAGFSVGTHSAGSRTFTLLSDAPVSSFAGATVSFAAASATWATAVVVIPPA